MEARCRLVSPYVRGSVRFGSHGNEIGSNRPMEELVPMVHLAQGVVPVGTNEVVPLVPTGTKVLLGAGIMDGGGSRTYESHK
jgi:hypothetical protein